MPIRALTPNDIPAIVQLRRAMFRDSERSDDAALANHYADVFFRSPWRDASVPSLVAEEVGEIVGFIGIIPRPFIYRGEAIRAAVSTDFMVHPAHRGLGGLLLQAFLRNGHDICIAD